jgi:hypothetical protein
VRADKLHERNLPAEVECSDQAMVLVILSDDSTPTDSKVVLLRSHDKIGFVSRKSSRSLPLLLRQLSKPDTWSATVLVNELDAGGFESAADREIVSGGHRSIRIR